MHEATAIAGQRTVRRRAAMAGIAAVLSFGAGYRPAVASESAALRVGGTGMALATMRQIGDAFAAEDHAATVQVLPSLGTGGGLAAVAGGAIDLALSARPLKDAERTRGLRALGYARTPIAFVTHPATSVKGITIADVADILAGRRLSWPDGTPIRLIRREPSDADWTMLRGLSPAMLEAVQIALERPGLLTVATDQDNADALERLSGSFGAMSIGQLRAEARGVLPLILDGAPPSVEAVLAGQYSLSRTLYVVWHEQPRVEADRFLAYLHGDKASAILERLGHVPLVGKAT